jgi:transcriptional regulator with XRE-family HTH domain
VKKYTRDLLGILAFGNHLREVRKKKGYSQEELANRADIELSQISRIERGVINTSLSQIFQIAKALNLHPKELFDFIINE